MQKRVLVYGLFFPAMLFYCCASEPGDEGAGGTYGGNAKTKFTGDVLKFKKFSYIDQMGTGLEAFSLLIPSDWQFEGGVRWALDVPMMPAVFDFRVYDPNSKAAFVVYPNHCFYWIGDTWMSSMHPPGSRYFGMEIQRPMSTLDALKYIVLPQARGQVEIIKEEPQPELAKLIGAGSQGYAEGAKVKFRFFDGSSSIEEELYGATEVLTIPTQSMYGTYYNYLWYVDYLFSFQAEEGKLDNYAKIFQTITSSYKVNPRWFAKYSNMTEYLAQNQIEHMRSMGELSRTLSQTSDQIRQESMQAFEERGRVMDKVNQNFSDYMLNIDRYVDPHDGREVELPSGYNHAWSNNLGECILSDDPNFNPNVGSNLHWESMSRK